MAGNSERIDDIVADAAVKQIDTLTQKANELEKQFIDTARAAIQLNAATGNSRSFKEYSTGVDASIKKIVQLQIEEKRLSNIRIDGEIKTKRLEKINISLANAIDKTAQSAAKALSPYLQLSKELDRQRLEAKDLAIQYGENSTQFLNAAKSVSALDGRLKLIDQTLGQSQRNVGNYRSGFNGLGNSINQMTRELPAFTFSVQTGFLALSNNLPIFFDEISRAKSEITRLRQAGEKVPGLFSTLAKSFLSFGTVMSIGITLLTLYGKEIGEFFKSMFKGTEALNAFAERQNNLNEALKNADYKKARTEVIELTTNIRLAKEGFLDKDDVLKQYNDTLGKTIGYADNLNQAEKLMNERAAAYIQLTFLKAQAQAALAKSVELSTEALGKSNEGFNFGDALKSYFTSIGGMSDIFAKAGGLGAKRTNDEAAELNKRADYYRKYFEGLEKQASDFAKKNKVGFFEDDKTKTKKGRADAPDLLGIEKEKLQLVLDNERSTYDERIKAIDNFERVSWAIISKGEEDKTYTTLQGDRLRLGATNDANKERLQVEDNAQKELSRILKAGQDIEKAVYENSKSVTEQYGDDRLEIIQDDANAALVALADQYARGLISTEQYHQQKNDIERQAIQESIQAQIDAVKLLLSIQEEFGIDTSSDRKKLADLERKLSKETTDAKIKDAEREAAKKKEINKALMDLATEVSDFTFDLLERGGEIEKNRLQEQADQIDVRKERDIAEVERSIGTEQEKADRIAIINAKAQAQKDIIAQKQRQIEQKQAQFEKLRSIAGIIQNTAQGVTSALAMFPPNPVLATIIGAIGAVQLARVLSTPIPKYAKGTDHKPTSGAMIVGERGTELVVNPDGSSYLTPDSASLAWGEKGTKVIPHEKLINMIARPDKVQYAGGQQIDMSQVINELKGVGKAIKSQKVNTTLITKKGFYRQQREMSKQSAYRNNHFN